MTAIGPGATAVAAARAVVGLYGDPDVSWSIVLEASGTHRLDQDEVGERLHDLVSVRPWLGAAAEVAVVGPDGLDGVRASFADTAYGDAAPLLRVAVVADEGTVVLAAHHGAVDGLGLLAVLSAVLGSPLVSTARGIGERPPVRGFVVGAAGRAVEALVAPPSRLATSGPATETGDHLLSAELPGMRIGTASACAAAAVAAERWNREHGRAAGRVVLAVGASRRPGSAIEADRDTAYLRVRVPPGVDRDGVRAAVAGTPPEPTFPVVRRAGLAQVLTRGLAARLGSTLLLSNLGAVSGGDLRRLAFWPVAAGRPGLAIGLATTVGGCTAVTVRARRRDLREPEARRFLDLVVEALAAD